MYRLAQSGKTGQMENCSGMTGNPPLPSPIEYGAFYNTFGANLDVAAFFGDAGSNGIPSAQNTIQTEALGRLEFESDHFFYDYTKCLSQTPTFSYGGTVGLQPALVMENLSSTTTIANPKNRPMFQDAFVWSLGPKINVATSHLSQIDLFANLGESYLISQVTSFKQGDNTVTATPVSNGVGQSAIYWETGLEWKYLNTDIATAYLGKAAVLSPPFTIAVGYRHDGRFKRSGDLVDFPNSQARLFFRFNLGLNKIGNWSGDQVTPDKGYTFKFGIDYEKPMINSSMPMPTATRYYVSANLDLVKLFKPPPAQ